MAKNLTFLIAFFITSQTNSMELICYLEQMPLDIQNYIASFLIEFESKEDFINRTKIQKTISDNDSCLYEQYIPKHDLLDLRLTHLGHAFNSSQTKVALLSEWTKGSWPEKVKLTIVNLTHKNKIIFHDFFDFFTKTPHDFALSEKGRIIGCIRNNSEKCSCATIHNTEETCQCELTLIYCDKTTIKQIKHFSFNGHASSLAFNKHGTRVILHGQTLSSKQKPNPSPYLFVSLKQKKSEQQKTLKSDKSNLLRYFEKKLICKNFHQPI